MTPKELFDAINGGSAIKYDGSIIEGVYEKKDINGDVTSYYVYDSIGREQPIYPGDYLIRDDIHKFTYEVVRASDITKGGEAAKG